MSLLDKLERKFGRYAIPNVTIGLIFVQVSLYIVSFGRQELLQGFYLVPALVLQGQWWRLLSFLVVPPVTNPIFAFFFWYLFYMMGSALEGHWGIFRYNIYLLIGYIATLAVSFLVPNQAATNAFLQGSVFLAFAYLYPDFQMYLFFIIPVKIKYLAILTWIFYFYTIAFGSWLDRLLVIASVSNFLLFFGSDIRYRIKTGRRHMEFQAKKFGEKKREHEPFHTCTVCRITDLTHPDMDFRYCPECAGSAGYCADHIRSHEHLKEASAPV